MTPPVTPPVTPPPRGGNKRIVALTAALFAAAAVIGTLRPGQSPVPPPAGGVAGEPACPSGRLVVMPARDTVGVRIVGDTVYITRPDSTLSLLPDSTGVTTAIEVGEQLSLAAVCAPSPNYRVRLGPVPTVPLRVALLK